MREKYISQEIIEKYKGQKALQQKSIIQQKGLFHLHTPQPHDYRLFKGIENWKVVSEETVFQKCNADSRAKRTAKTYIPDRERRNSRTQSVT